MACKRPPLDGSLSTLIDFVDFHAIHNSAQPWFVYTTNPSTAEISRVSFADMFHASHQIATAFNPEGRDPGGEVVALLLHTDTIIYVAVVLGLIRAGYTPFPMSPRNSTEGICHMLQATYCRRILFQSSTSSLVDLVKTEMTARGVALQLDDLAAFDNVLLELISTNKSRLSDVPTGSKAGHPVDLERTMVYIHSSGSTGLPKSVPSNHRQVLSSLRRNIFATSKNAPSRIGAMGLPSFHAMGLLAQVFLPLCTAQDVAVFAPQYPAPPVVLSPTSVFEVARATNCAVLVSPPSFIEFWSHSPDALEYLKTLKALIFGGGPLSLAIGDRLVAAGVPLFAGYGGSEFGNPTKSLDDMPRPEVGQHHDWAWLQFSPYADTRFEPQGDGSYELIIYDSEEYQVNVYNVPGERAYATSDLFQPHPSKEGLWRIVGRKDDVLTLSTGEKIVPLPQEGRINASPLVAGCMMFGREREQAGILIEPAAGSEIRADDQDALVGFRDKIWPVVEEANSTAPAFARIFKEMILVTDPGRPLPRTAKNTIVRKQATALYVNEIEQLYNTVQQSTNAQGVSPPNSWCVEDLRTWLLVHAKLVANKGNIEPTVNLFYQGFDSLSATFFRNRIIGTLRSSGIPLLRDAAKAVSANLVFDYPTIEELAVVLSELADSRSDAMQRVSQAGASAEYINGLFTKFSADLPSPRAWAEGAASEHPVILLTGSTGNIGAHILAYLLADERIAKVYTLNRPSNMDPLSRLKAVFRDRDLPAEELDSDKLVTLVGDVSQDIFGIETGRYDELVGSVTHIIHNAWTVNFNLPLQSYEGQIAGVRRLIDVCAAVDHPVKLLVTSSIGVANGWDPADGPVPESPLDDANAASSTGYTASKFVVEKLIHEASVRGIAATTVRTGQVCGPRKTGAWGVTEWFPIMVKSSVTLGCLPAMSGPVPWVPLDAVGQTYVDWVVSPDRMPDLINLVHPHPTTWDVILRGIHEATGHTLTTISLDEWLKTLEALSVNAIVEDMVNIPALKLLQFFRNLTPSGDPTRYISSGVSSAPNKTYAVDALIRSSPTMRKLQPVSEEHARMWVKYWKEKGYIS